MSHKKNTSGNECPICGGVIWGRGQKVLIEGAKMTVCDSCAQHGTKIRSSPSKKKPSPTSSPKKEGSSPKQTPYVKAKEDTEEQELVSDYANRIRNARMKSKLNQEKFAAKLHEKVSLIKRIETGKAQPTIQLAKKIEQTYGITLLQKTNQEEINYKSYIKRGSGSSLGDIAFIKKKK